MGGPINSVKALDDCGWSSTWLSISPGSQHLVTVTTKYPQKYKKIQANTRKNLKKNDK